MSLPRISAVSFLNTTPLVWGLLHGPQQGLAEVSFAVPSTCADLVASGGADVGIIPVVEVDRHQLPYARGLGIASQGPVRSIFLISNVPAAQIRSVAMDTSSRTSVRLARIVLSRKYGVKPALLPHSPDAEAMLRAADAALLIGDPALRLPLLEDGRYVYDLGEQWTEITGLPMVYAVWAGVGAEAAAGLLRDSYEYGRGRIGEIVAREAAPRGIAPELADIYLRRHIVYELGAEHELGMARFLEWSRELES